MTVVGDLGGDDSGREFEWGVEDSEEVRDQYKKQTKCSGG